MACGPLSRTRASRPHASFDWSTPAGAPIGVDALVAGRVITASDVPLIYYWRPAVDKPRWTKRTWTFLSFRYANNDQIFASGCVSQYALFSSRHIMPMYGGYYAVGWWHSCTGRSLTSSASLWSLSAKCPCNNNNNSNNNNNYDNVYRHHDTVIARVHPVHLMNANWASAGSPPTLRPNQPMWAVSPPIGCCHPQTPSPFIIITQLVSCYSFYRPTEGGRLSRPRHCSKGAKPVPKAVYLNC